MASTYTTSLQIQKIGNGEQSGIWGTTTNTNWDLIEQSVAGVQSITMVNADYTLSVANGASDEARNAVLVVGGTNTAIRKIVAPLVPKVYVVFNNTSGGYSITIGGATGTAVTILNAVSTIVYCDGTNFYSAIAGTATSFGVNGNLSVTGAVTFGETLTSSTGSIKSSSNIYNTQTVTSITVAAPGIVTVPTGLPSGTPVYFTLAAGATLPTGLSANTTYYVVNPSSNTFNLAATQGGTAITTTGSAASGVITMVQPVMNAVNAISSYAATTATTATTANALNTSNSYTGAAFSDTLGNVRNIPINNKTASYTLQATDNGQCISITTGGVIVPASILSAGQVVTVYNNSGSDQTITQGSGVTLQWAGQTSSTTGNRTLGLYGVATILCVASNSFVISGAGLT